MLVAPDGNVWVIDTTQIVKVASDGSKTVAATLPSVPGPEGDPVGGSRLSLLNGVLYATNSEWDQSLHGETPPPNVAAVLKVSDGGVMQVASTWEFEKTSNPDGGNLHSHPYGLTAGSDGYLYIADAGGNDLVKVNPSTGQVSLVTVFPSFPNNAGFGPPVSQPVPTGVVMNPDGSAYVGFLRGFPFTPATSKVVKVMPNGAISDYATGLTSLTDLRRGPDGNLYAVQFAVWGAEAPAPNTGAFIRVKPGVASEVVLSGLSFPTSVDFNAAGDAFVTINGVGAPGSGAVVKYGGVARPTTPPTPPPPAEIPEPTTLLLLGSGLAALAGYAYRRRQN